MSSHNAIGGYFGLDRHEPQPFPGHDQILLNSGRACFEYILRMDKVDRVWLPKYTCDVMLEPLKELNISFEFYPLDENLELKDELKLGASDLLVYTNYFGIKDAYCQSLNERFKNKVVFDFSQALFSVVPAESSAFFSPRKFFGLPDGGILISSQRLKQEIPVDESSNSRMSHLVIRATESAEAGYEEYKRNDASLSGRPMERMSKETYELLEASDFSFARERRSENFAFLHEQLGQSNLLMIDATLDLAPMCYPYRTEDSDLRDKLIEQKIFVATYWPNVFEWCDDGELEYQFAKYILPLPLDQRYSKNDMSRLIDAIFS